MKLSKKLILIMLALTAVFCITFGITVVSAENVRPSGSASGEVEGVVTIDSFLIEEEAEIRMNSPKGIRFTSSISLEDLNKLPNDAVFGTLLIPKSLLSTDELTFAVPQVKDVVANVGNKTEDGLTYTAVLVGRSIEEDFMAENADVDLVARAYVKYTDKNGTEQVIYSSSSSTRSMVQVACNALASGAISDSGITMFLMSMVEDIVVDDISFEVDNITVPTNINVKLPEIENSKGLTPKFTANSDKVSFENGFVKCSEAGEYTITAKLGVKEAELTINATNSTRKELAMKEIQCFTAEDIKNAISIDIPEGLTNIVDSEVLGYTVNENKLIYTISNENARGEVSVVCFDQDGKAYSFDIIIADEIIETAERFKAIMWERTNKTPNSANYYVLGADITLGDTKYKSNTNYNETSNFIDTFDGRGFKLTDSASAIWTKGIFNTLADNAVVKNVIIENALIDMRAGNGGDITRIGAVAKQVNDNAVIENVVLLNPVARDNANNTSAQANGMIAGAIYGNAKIKNCVVIDNRTTQNTSATTYTGSEYTGNTKFNAILGVKGGSGNVNNITGTYCITTHGYHGACLDKEEGAYILDNLVLSSFADFVDEVGDSLSNYTLFDNDYLNIKIGDQVLYTYTYESEKLFTMQTAKVFDVNNISDNTIEVTLPKAIGSEIKMVAGAVSATISGTKLTAILADLTTGDRYITILTETGCYEVNVCLADKVFKTYSDFKTYMKNRSSTASSRKYLALDADITDFNDSKYNNDTAYTKGISFYDTFDGRGHSISNGTAFIWTAGIFDAMDGATVKNLAVIRPLVVSDAYAAEGVFSTFFKNSSILENCLVINPAVRNMGTGYSYGMLVGRADPNCKIIDCVVFEDWTSTPANGTGYDSNGLYTGDGRVNGILSYLTSGSSITIQNTYCVTKHPYLAGTLTSTGTTDDFGACMVNSYAEFATKADLTKYFFTNNLVDDKDTVTFSNDTISEVVYQYPTEKLFTMQTAKVFEVSTIVDNTITVELPKAIGTEVEKVSGISSASISGTTLTAVLNSTTARGDVFFTVRTEEGKYEINICLADKVFSTAAEFKAYMLTDSVKSTADNYKYLALANNLDIGDTKYNGGTAYTKDNAFYDVFDGRGHTMSNGAVNGTGILWTCGIFNIISGNAGVKNLIVVRPLVPGDAGDRGGVIAYKMSDNAYIENCIIINPITKGAPSNAYYGVIVGQHWRTTTRITNCLVFDNWTTNPWGTGYENGKYNGAGQWNAIIGITNATPTVTNTYCVSGNYTRGGYSSATSNSLLDNLILADYATLKTKANLNNYTLLVDNGETVSAGGVVVYTYPAE